MRVRPLVHDQVVDLVNDKDGPMQLERALGIRVEMLVDGGFEAAGSAVCLEVLTRFDPKLLINGALTA